MSRSLANRWHSTIVSYCNVFEASLAQEWLDMERWLDPYIAAYSFAPEADALRRKADLLVAARVGAQRTLRSAESAILDQGLVFSGLGRGAGEQIIRELGIPRKTNFVPQGWDDRWHETLWRAEAAALQGLERATGNRETLESVHEMQRGLARGFQSVLMAGRDYPMHEFRANLQAYDSPKGWIRLVTLSQGTCMACIMLDGVMYEDPEQFIDHPFGLCFLVPYDRPMGQRGKEWFLKLSPEEQQRIMGPEYWAAWQRGEFELEDLILMTTAGFAKVKPLKDLQEGYDES